jgi:hypothetical protein
MKCDETSCINLPKPEPGLRLMESDGLGHKAMNIAAIQSFQAKTKL